MDNSPVTSRATTEPLAAALLKIRDELLTTWTAQVKHTIPVAAIFTTSFVAESLSILFDNIIEVLAFGITSPVESKLRKIARMHGENRARSTHYTPEDLVREMQLLRNILFSTVKERGLSINANESEIVGQAIEITARESICGYSSVSAEINTTFIASLSHDLRNPLHSANAIAQIIQLKVPDPSLANMARRVCDKLRELDGMIQALLDASLSNARMKLPLKIEFSDLIDLIQDVCSDSRTLGRKVDVIGNSVKGWWCRASMKRALENLLSNADKYGMPNGIITVKVSSLEDRVMLSVHNEGVPIPIHEQSRLFRPFERMGNVNVEGWGLGLSLVQNVVESHGGRVLVDSDAERGTTFILQIPLDARSFAIAN